MHTIDKTTWPRRRHFELFRAMDFPYSSLCANVDVSRLRRRAKERGLSFTVSLVHALSTAANALPEFRQRIRGDDVVEHAVVHPSLTVLAEGDLFGFCLIPYAKDLAAFAAAAERAIARAKVSPTLEDEPGRDDLLYLTGVPWVSFTALGHPMHLSTGDSIPRIAWGRFFPQGGRLLMPLSVQVHHALVDGVHLGRFYERAQEELDQLERRVA